jgi:hypothetical protein
MRMRVICIDDKFVGVGKYHPKMFEEVTVIGMNVTYVNDISVIMYRLLEYPERHHYRYQYAAEAFIELEDSDHAQRIIENFLISKLIR